PGVYRGPVTIARRVTLFGPPEAIVRSDGHGTTLTVTAGGAQVLGLTIDGSGARYDQDDAAIAVRGASDVRIEAIRVVRALFGVHVERARNVTIRGCDVEGVYGESLGLRGDGIKLWEVRDSLVLGNRVRGSRDLVVWYSPNNRLIGNLVVGGRYGAHMMYSSDVEVGHNRFVDDVVGTFVMYSRRVHVHDNILANAPDASGMGLGVKDSGLVTVENNLFVRDRIGVYLDTSPLDPVDENSIRNNAFRLTDQAIVFHGRAAGNRIEDNLFKANREQVVVEGGGDALAAQWLGNYFDDYEGYDLDGDGFGDLAYEERSLAADLTRAHPQLALLRGTPAMGIVDVLGSLVPLFAPATLVRDPRPRVAEPRVGPRSDGWEPASRAPTSRTPTSGTPG
ncbi:MAG: nitrous oxide reductase family maturation protein NosD, partial [Sandaracinaceae bacterium]|nr:nitrous oxide reductase family maturation protein NosD [Sandaracinaceae bacterium]